MIAGYEQRVVKTDERPRNPVAVFTLARDGIHRTESPAISIAPPFAAGSSDFSIEVDEAGNDPIVAHHAIQPGIHVLDNPLLVFRVSRDQEGVQR